MTADLTVTPNKGGGGGLPRGASNNVGTAGASMCAEGQYLKSD